MVKGLDHFRERFKSFEDSFILIGGAACDQWFKSMNLEFRSTRDLDIVLIIEEMGRDFVAVLRAYIAEGNYEICERSEQSPILYRFARPKNDSFPFMLELFSRKPEGLLFIEGQGITPISLGNSTHSLSALLLDDNYYTLIRSHKGVRDGLPCATATALIPLKAHAWLNLTKQRTEVSDIDSRDIAKHRNDVFRLAGTLPGVAGPVIPESIKMDLVIFLRAFPEDSPEWPQILSSIKMTLGGGIRPASLRLAIQIYFQLPHGSQKLE